MRKDVKLGKESREELIKGINILSDAVTSTLGPNGRNVIYTTDQGVYSTKDGVTVAKNIEELDNEFQNAGINLIKQAAIKTADKAGDGTTTSTLLTSTMVNKGAKYVNENYNSVHIKRGIEDASKQVIKYIKENIKTDIDSSEQINNIATISANNDSTVGALIQTALEYAGAEGSVHIEESKTGETYLEKVEGMQLNRGYKSPYFVTNNDDMSTRLENPFILITDQKITKAKEILKILEYVSAENKSILIICKDIEGEALATMIVNKSRGIIKAAAIQAPEFGDRQKLVLEDIAVHTGGQVVSLDKGMKFESFNKEWLGKARTITVTKDTTTIIDGEGDTEQIQARIEQLKNQIDNAITPFEKEKVQERLAKFTGGVSIIHVGGQTEAELKETKDRVEDALYASKAAIAEGIVPGGGISLLRASEEIKYDNTQSESYKIGQRIVKESCKQPFIKILSNAGYEYDKIVMLMNKIINTKDVNLGINVLDGKVINMIEKGVIDPFKVTRVSLLNAASIAGTILLTECVIVNSKDQDQPAENPMMGMGGMF